MTFETSPPLRPRLEPFQRRIARALADVEEVVSCSRAAAARRRCSPRYALWHLLEVEDARVNFTAGTREQAALAYEHAVSFAHRLGDDRLHATRRELHFRPDPSSRRFTRFMRVRPGEADALQGLDSTLAVIDEMHTATDSDAYVAMVGSLKAPGAKLRIISTAAPSADSPLGRLRARALALPGADAGAAPWSRPRDRTSTCSSGAVPRTTKLTDRRRILAANPASWRTWEVLRKQPRRGARVELPSLLHEPARGDRRVGLAAGGRLGRSAGPTTRSRTASACSSGSTSAAPEPRPRSSTSPRTCGSACRRGTAKRR